MIVSICVLFLLPGLKVKCPASLFRYLNTPLVSQPPFGENVSGVFGILFDFLPEAFDVYRQSILIKIAAFLSGDVQ